MQESQPRRLQPTWNGTAVTGSLGLLYLCVIYQSAACRVTYRTHSLKPIVLFSADQQALHT